MSTAKIVKVKVVKELEIVGIFVFGKKRSYLI